MATRSAEADVSRSMLRWVSTIAQANASARQRATTPTNLTIRRRTSHIISLPFPLREDYQHARRRQAEWTVVGASGTKVGKIAQCRRGTRDLAPADARALSFFTGRPSGRRAKLLEDAFRHDSRGSIAGASGRVDRRGSRATLALVDLYRRDRLRCDPAVEPWPHSPDDRFGPHVFIVGHRADLRWGFAALSLANDRRLARRRCRKARGEQNRVGRRRFRRSSTVRRRSRMVSSPTTSGISP